MAEQLEVEQKFDVDPGFERPDFAALCGLPGGPAGSGEDRVSAAAPVLHHLSASYFDTPDGRLAGHRITLRRRTGGPDAGWHLKLPADGGRRDGATARLEVRAPLSAGGERAVPAELAARVARVTGGRPLAPVAVIDTERTVVTIAGRGGRVLAEIADDVVTARRLTAAGGAEPRELRWREIEVELVSGGPWLLRAAAGLLLAAGARPAAHGSKLARALGR